MDVETDDGYIIQMDIESNLLLKQLKQFHYESIPVQYGKQIILIINNKDLSNVTTFTEIDELEKAGLYFQNLSFCRLLQEKTQDLTRKLTPKKTDMCTDFYCKVDQNVDLTNQYVYRREFLKRCKHDNLKHNFKTREELEYFHTTYTRWDFQLKLKTLPTTLKPFVIYTVDKVDYMMCEPGFEPIAETKTYREMSKPFIDRCVYKDLDGNYFIYHENRSIEKRHHQ